MVKEVVRVKTLDAGRLLDNALRTGLNLRLSAFKLTAKKVSELEALCKEGKLTAEVLYNKYFFSLRYHG